MRRDVDIPVLRTQEREVGNRGLGPRQDDQRGIAGQRLTRWHHNQPDAGFVRNRIEVVEIGDPRQHRHRDGDRAIAGGCGVEHNRVFGGQLTCGGKPRDHAQPRPAGAAFDFGIAIIEQPDIPAKLVDQEPLDHRCIVRVDHHLRADDRGDHAAAVDVADQHHRHASRTGKAHIGDVARA